MLKYHNNVPRKVSKITLIYSCWIGTTDLESALAIVELLKPHGALFNVLEMLMMRRACIYVHSSVFEVCLWF